MMNISLFYVGYFVHVTPLKIGQKQYFKVNTTSSDTQDFCCIKMKWEDELIGCTM